MITVIPWHWLNENGSLPDEPRLRKQALLVAQCIEYGGSLPRGHARETLIACRRKPRGKTCLGLWWVLKQDDDAIHAFCGLCKSDEYLIYEWEDTDWADGQMEPMDVATVAEDRGKEPRKPRVDDQDVLLRRALEIVGCTLTVEHVKKLVQESAQPTTVLHAIISNTRSVPEKAALERLMPVLMEFWNSTPRPDLGGRTPTEMVGTARAIA